MNLPIDQIETLQKHFRTSIQDPVKAIDFQSVQELLNPVYCQKYLQQIAQEFHTSSLIVVASQFAKRYASMIVPPTLYAMSVYHKGLQVDPQNCYMVPSYNDHGSWLPKLALSDWVGTSPANDRVVWRDQLLKQLFVENITPMWDVLSQCTGIQQTVLWENTAIYIHRLYRKTLAEHPQAQSDYQYLVNVATPDLFGASLQPLKRFRLVDGCRKTCCLAFLTNDEKRFCKSCPRAQTEQVKIRSMVTS